MNTWMFIGITVLNGLSLFIFLIVNRETRRVTESHIDLIQKVNAALVETSVLKVARFAYFIGLSFLIIVSYFLYFFWAL
jgi:positive regulator of sigma E activity